MNELDKNYENRHTGWKGPSGYIGDGAYVQFLSDRGDYIVYTSDGFGVTNKVFIEFEHMDNLISFHNTIKEMEQ